jgi:excisionase family DNA binding protein
MGVLQGKGAMPMSIIEYERPVLLTVEQAAEYLTVSERFIRRIRYEGRIPGVKLGKHLRFKKDDLDRFIEEGIKQPRDLDGRLS